MTAPDASITPLSRARRLGRIAHFPEDLDQLVAVVSLRLDASIAGGPAGAELGSKLFEQGRKIDRVGV